MAALVVTSSLLLLLSVSVSLPASSIAEPTFIYNVCDNSSTFPTNSKYHTNLKSLFKSLSGNATSPGSSLFFASSAGAATPDAVYGLFLCRGDQNSSSCGDCVDMATSTDLPTIYCPNRRVAVVYYDQCMVRYSNESILGKLEQNSGITLMNTANINGNSTQLNLLLAGTMRDMAKQAAAGDRSGKKFAVKQVNFTKDEDLYMLVQCTPDLSGTDCSKCLEAEIPKILIKKMGAQTLLPSCIARYETYPFYVGAINISSSPSPSLTNSSTGNSTTPPSTSTKGKNKASTRVIIAIMVPVVIVSLVALIIGICCIKKKAKHDAGFFDHGEDFTTVESLQYDLATLQSTTNNFSIENKLGEGGFGSVYKEKSTKPGQHPAIQPASDYLRSRNLSYPWISQAWTISSNQTIPDIFQATLGS